MDPGEADKFLAEQGCPREGKEEQKEEVQPSEEVLPSVEVALSSPAPAGPGAVCEGYEQQHGGA
jgi:hypothetical protein